MCRRWRADRMGLGTTAAAPRMGQRSAPGSAVRHPHAVEGSRLRTRHDRHHRARDRGEHDGVQRREHVAAAATAVSGGRRADLALRSRAICPRAKPRESNRCPPSETSSRYVLSGRLLRSKTHQLRFLITTAVDGQADRNSTDICTLAGTSDLAIRTNPNLGKNVSAVVVNK